MRYAPSAEFRLVAACCAWPRSPERTKKISAAAASSIDWQRLVQIVERHRVAGLVHDGLTVARVALRQDTAQTLADAAENVARHGLKLAAEALNVQRAFTAAGIPAVFLKGTTLSLLAYRNLTVKMSLDVDVLVPGESVKSACDALRGNGYVRVAPLGDTEDDRFDGWIATANEATFQHAARRTLVDLHWRLADDHSLTGRFTPLEARRAIEVSPGAALCTLGDEDLFTFLCLHGAHHAWSRLKWLADLHAWLAGKSDPEIARLYRAAATRGVERAAMQALLLCHAVFDLEFPASVLSDARGDVALDWLVQIALGAMGSNGRAAETQDRLLGGLDILFSQFLLSSSPRGWLAVVRASSIGYGDYRRFPLPRILFFLYPLLRAPSWIWRHSTRMLKNH